MRVTRTHVVYLAIIAVLIIVIVVAAAKAVRASRVLAEVEERFGLKEGVRASLPRKGGSALRRAGGEDLLRPRTYDQYRREVDALLERAQALEEFGPKTRLSDACAAALKGGKRLRAVILLEVARATSARRLRAHREGRLRGDEPTPVDAAEAALFLEYVHAASLVIDDHPDFDNDPVRRGEPALHAAVGPATAQMAALSLIAAAFQNICRQVDWIRDHCPEVKNADRIGTRICSDISRALGALGAAGGQYMDVSSAEELTREHGADAVSELMYRKTATFFEIALVAGWLAAGGEPEQVAVMRDIGRHVGTAFQIADDLGDAAADAARTASGKLSWNFANEYGRDVAAREMDRNLKGARFLLTQCSLWTPVWEEIYGLVRQMAGTEGDPTAAPTAEPTTTADAQPR
jgi:geranylgeranyl diphosphate synthase type II